MTSPACNPDYDPDILRSQMAVLRLEAAARSKKEQEILSSFENTESLAKNNAETRTETTNQSRLQEISATEKEFRSKVSQIEAWAVAEIKKLDEQRNVMASKIKALWKKQDGSLHEEYEFDEGQEKETFKEKRKNPIRILAKTEKEIASASAHFEDSDKAAASFLAACRIPEPQKSDSQNSSEPLPQTEEVLKLLEDFKKQTTNTLQRLQGTKNAKTAASGATKAAVAICPIIIGGVLAAAGFCGMYFKISPDNVMPASITAGVLGLLCFSGSLAGGILLYRRFARVARQTCTSIRIELIALLEKGRACSATATVFAKSRQLFQSTELEERFKKDYEDRSSIFKNTLAQLTSKRDAALADLEGKYSKGIDTIKDKREAGKKAANDKYPPRVAALRKTLAEELASIKHERDETLSRATAQRTSDWDALSEKWKSIRLSTQSVYDDANAIDSKAFTTWDVLSDDSQPLPEETPPGIRFGSLSLSLEKVPGGISKHSEMNKFGPTLWTQPAILKFPLQASVLLKTTTPEKERASEMLQALLLRIASGVPAGKTRFTIIDPLGLGKHFAGFMHLADYDELLITSRIWTEPQQIEQRLADTTEQMELVIQKYLRNEYESIGAYNADAEVPEPYRFIVVANFPANFTETAARRLASIATSGPRCGVFMIVSVDTKLPMPPNFSLADLEKHSTVVVLKDNSFSWNDPEFSKWPFTVEQSPSDDIFTKIVHRIGKQAKASKRVEVPFERVAPKEEAWWTGSTASEIDVPLGPAGAKKMQHMKLGKGTSQHVLIAGKTGSGKSTMMHALITNLSLMYSPDELQFYLIDFKKGVEFKVYDHYRLPHARVIAIESEREFGLSVLEQLDRELKRRGDLFRDLAVQDLAGYRGTGHPEPMPRVLLIIDEFQELFIEDDKLAQDSSLVLDRLVRQGRAFGMHVLLGSQTLGGSYSLPRSTMGQMAVRIALQCSDADASLILSEENSAARLLTRPGEAIYNDANGMLIGNNPFQVVWLGDERREKYLSKLRALADSRTDIKPLPRIVFDGNQPADPAGNQLLEELLTAGTIAGKPLLTPVAWFGDAIAIKDPTTAIFRRQGGANLLVVGQREDLAVSILAMSIVGLAAAHDPFPNGALGRSARFVLLEPAAAEEHPDLLLSQLSQWLPHEFESVGRLGVTDSLESIATEVQRRLDEQVLDGEAIFVIVRDLARFRELRRSEGDFGYSFGEDKKAGPAQNFTTLLKDGPTVGIHLLVWCDSLTNLMRTFERGTLKEFELRVLFQMSGSDSSQLVDSPMASKLGPQRALFIHEETGTLEKFRPYSFPQAPWLEIVSGTLRARRQGTPQPRPIRLSQENKPKTSEDLMDFSQFSFSAEVDVPIDSSAGLPKRSSETDSFQSDSITDNMKPDGAAGDQQDETASGLES